MHPFSGKQLPHLLLTTILILSPNLAHADDRNLLPKYGSLPKADWQKAADDKFISATDDEYHGDRNKASADLATYGWQYLQQGNRADAMRRFNQAWLLNPNNGTALWGMAAIQASSGKFADSLKLFAEAEKFIGSEVNFSVDYAKALGMAGIKSKDQALLNDAFARFESIHQTSAGQRLESAELGDHSVPPAQILRSLGKGQARRSHAQQTRPRPPFHRGAPVAHEKVTAVTGQVTGTAVTVTAVP